MGKPVGWKGVNTRLGRLKKAFPQIKDADGNLVDNPIVAYAKKTIFEKVPKEFLSTKKGSDGKDYYTGGINPQIQNPYDAKTQKEDFEKFERKRQIFMKKTWVGFNEALPTVNDVYKREIQRIIDSGEDTHGIDLTGKFSEIKKNEMAMRLLNKSAFETARLLNDNDDIINNLYLAEKDDEFSKQHVAKSMHSELLEKPWLAYDGQFLRDAQWIVDEWLLERSKRGKSQFEKDFGSSF